LLSWLGKDQDYYAYIKENWNTSILNGGSWNDALHDGYIESNVSVEAEGDMVSDAMESVTAAAAINTLQENTSGALELVLYTKTGLGDGQQANNPWLQELPDPITRTTWDNY